MTPFKVTRAGGGGMTYQQVRDLQTPTTGVRSLDPQRDWWATVKAYGLVLAPHAVFSHQTAAQLLSLPLPKADPLPFHVTVPRGKARGCRKGVTWHCRDLSDAVTMAQGAPVTNGLRTWQDLAASLSVPDLVATADVLLRRRHCSRDQLLDTTGVRHARFLSKAAAMADPRSASARESVFRVAMVDAGLPLPELNKDIIEQGIWLGSGDFVWEQYRVIADYDGEHHNSASQRHQDAATRNAYTAHGWRHVVITKTMTNKMHVAVAFVVDALRQRGWRG